MTSHSADSQEPLDKGKRRAKDPTERTPLLFNGTSQASYYDERTAVAQEVSTRRLRSWLTVVFLTSLALCILLFVAAALLAWTYASKISTSSPEDIVQNALVSHGPESVDIINVTSTGEIWVKVEARLGVDAGSVIGVNSDTHQDGFFTENLEVFGAVGGWEIRAGHCQSVRHRHRVWCRTLNYPNLHRGTTHHFTSHDESAVRRVMVDTGIHHPSCPTNQ